MFENAYKIILKYFCDFLRLMYLVRKGLVNQGFVGMYVVVLKNNKK